MLAHITIRFKVKVVITDGHQPYWKGIAPQFEAIDILSVRAMKKSTKDLKKGP